MIATENHSTGLDSLFVRVIKDLIGVLQCKDTSFLFYGFSNSSDKQ